MNKAEFELYRKFLNKLCKKSASVIMPYFRKNPKIDYKEDVTPVTIADRLAENIMRKLIMQSFPDHGIIGEEYPPHNPQAAKQWILDPIDGTKNFICGTEMFGTLIAFMYNGQPILSVINFPALKLRLFGDNSICTLNGSPVSVNPVDSLSDAVLLTTDHLLFKKHQDEYLFNKLINRVKLYRTWGDCYGYYLLATGFAHIMVDPIMSPWDIMALIPIIRGAGGIISDYHGNDPVAGDSIIAAHPNIYNDVINLLNNRMVSKAVV